MSKVLFAFVIGLSVGVPLAAGTASAQSRLGPAEDDSPVVSSTPAKVELKKETAKGEKPATIAKPASKNEPKSEPKGDEPKGDAAKSEAQKTQAVLTSAAPNLNASATTNTTSDAAPNATAAPLPVFGSPSMRSIPAPPKYEPPAPGKTSEAAKGTNTPATNAANTPDATSTNATAVSNVNDAPANNPAASTTLAPASSPAAATVAPTALYRVGVGDILDIRLAGGMSKDSTLYTIMSTGMLDYPLAGEPFNANGLTTDEIGARLSSELKRRGVFDRAQFRIVVREYASHTATVSGLVDQPGAKILRREAVPLYVVLSEANPRAEAGRAVIISRATGRSKTVDLSDSAALNELVSHGDIINITARPQEFFYIGGQINAPGQKDFHPGITLTQAILASGGVARVAGNKVKVTVSRQGADGRLVLSEFLLNDIETGQVPDPRLQAGDRVEVGRRR
ncbi:MAG: polysaccharide biosynthesis/export protein [Pyrinomonadaceae bacterium]|jgi:protein involved in polysaccharide export with SLBB domain|nr:polysaccharide biosynthesis/export protein [Pyrinomonadaceae bacterium]